MVVVSKHLLLDIVEENSYQGVTCYREDGDLAEDVTLPCVTFCLSNSNDNASSPVVGYDLLVSDET